MYGDRFPDIAFAVGETCERDDRCTNIVTRWRPRLVDHFCGACNPAYGPHPAGNLCFHPRLVEVAAAADGYEFVVFTEDDCVLAPRIDPTQIRRRCADMDAIVPFLSFCDRDDTSWVWTQHPTGYPAFDRVSDHFDRGRLLRHWAAFGGIPAPPVLYVPMFSGFVDFLVFRVDFIRRLVADLRVLEDVWHETAIPTAILHNTTRIGLADGVALWGAGRERSLEDLMGMLAAHDFVHPIKLSWFSDSEILDAYRRL
jgi:hypothetical protein